VILAQDANDIHEAFEHVLELTALAPDGDQDLVAVEGPLPLPDGLVAVRRLLQQVHRRDERRARRAFVARTPRRAREVEAGESRRVEVGVAPREHLGEPRPQEARALRVPAPLPGDGRLGDEPRALVLLRGLREEASRAVLPRGLRPGDQRTRPIDGRHVGHEGTLRALVPRIPIQRERAASVARTKQHIREIGQRGDVLLLARDGVPDREKERVLGALEISASGQGAGLIAQLVDRATGDHDALEGGGRWLTGPERGPTLAGPRTLVGPSAASPSRTVLP
jgi:hypothetical protein